MTEAACGSWLFLAYNRVGMVLGFELKHVKHLLPVGIVCIPVPTETQPSPGLLSRTCSGQDLEKGKYAGSSGEGLLQFMESDF